MNMVQQKKTNRRRCRQPRKQPKMSSSSILLILSLLIALGNAEDCELRCMNGSKCVAGSANFDDHPKEDDGSDLPFHSDELSQGSFHCACSEGFTGLTCAIPYESCADASDMHNCYHGAPCVPTGEDDFGNTQYDCDCSVISDLNKGYTGKYCQNEHLAKITCDPTQGISCQNGGVCMTEDNGDRFCQCDDRFHGSLCELDSGISCGDSACFNGSPCIQTDQGDVAYCDCSQTTVPNKRFVGISCEQELSVQCDESKTCLNGGECIEEANGSFSCDCTDEWRGPSCEYASFDHEVSVVESCDQECLNGGTCGRSPVDSSDESLGVEDHCVCPVGWTGAKCEYKYEECGNGEHICVHGSKCVQKETGSEWTCQCEEEYREDQNYQGEFCQHHKMTVCTTADTALQLYDGPASAMYCVNDATCVTIEENGRTFPACQCPDGYRGPHCEFLGPPVLIIEEPSGLGIVASAATVFGFILMAVAIGVCFGFVVLQRRALQRVIVELPKAPIYLDNPIRALWNDDDDSLDLQSLEDVDLGLRALASEGSVDLQSLEDADVGINLELL